MADYKPKKFDMIRVRSLLVKDANFCSNISKICVDVLKFGTCKDTF